MIYTFSLSLHKSSNENLNMTIYYYHTRPVKEAMEEWRNFRHPGHILYGLPLLSQYGIECIFHRFRYFPKRLSLMLYVAKEILFCRKKYDALYATSFRGIELIIFLRALGLYRKPIIIWHHTAVTTSTNRYKELLSRFFYKGIDKMFFFSRKLINDSLKNVKAPQHKLKLVHWGPDLAFYDHLKEELSVTHPEGFISTGKENRDIKSLLKAFSETDYPLDVYIAESCGNLNYKNIIGQFVLPDHIHVHFTEGIIPYELARIVAQKSCVVIPCLEYPYTVGLTTLVEAFALGIPVICSRNPNFEMDIDKEKIGITVAYNDVEGWINAIRYISEHPEEAKEMGRNARKLAEERFNLEILSREIAETILELDSFSTKNRTFAQT